jgi:HEPN domain-containing protein
MDSVTRQWIERSQYDLKTARSLLKSRRYLYVAFMCQQCIEKIIKGYISARGQLPPYLHNLARIAEKAELLSGLSNDHQQLLADLNPFYIKARYGEYRSALSTVCKKEKAVSLLKKTEEFILWLKPKIK